MRRAAESHQLFVRRRSEAQSTVEVALSLPVVMLVFVLITLGWVIVSGLFAFSPARVGRSPGSGHWLRVWPGSQRQRRFFLRAAFSALRLSRAFCLSL